MPQEINSVAVIGGGYMGAGIAEVSAVAGMPVVVRDLQQFLDGARRRVERSLAGHVKKGRMDEAARDEVLGRISFTSELKDVAGSDLVIEAIPENLDLKLSLMRELDEIVDSDTVIGTNTSSIPIAQLASKVHHPERVVGIHFFSPVPVMKLVEIVRGAATSVATYDATQQLAGAMGKISVEVNDSPGFVSNRVLMPMINEAIFAVYEGVGTAGAIDEIMKLGMNHPMGPLQLADFIGLDVCLAIMNVLYDGFDDSKYRPCPLLKKYVDAGWLGRKSGRGFYQY